MVILYVQKVIGVIGRGQNLRIDDFCLSMYTGSYRLIVSPLLTTLCVCICFGVEKAYTMI